MTPTISCIDELRELAEASSVVTQSCSCAIDALREWTRTPIDFPQAQMRTAGTLLQDPYAEPTFAEYHPHGTGYWSPDRRSRILSLQPLHGPAMHGLWPRLPGVCGSGGYYVEPAVRSMRS
jgi:hypothetical protein